MGDESIFGRCFEVGFRSMCPSKCDQHLLHCEIPFETHQFLDDEKYQLHKGHLVALFRQPEQRLLSAWNDDEELFRASPNVITRCSDEKMTAELSMEEFIHRWASWETRQLIGKSLGDLSEDDTLKAIKRLEEGFAFVGIQEEWELSICLFHAKFGGKCLPVDFEDTRPSGNTSTSSTYNTSILNGWVDEADGKVYARAKEIFRSDLLKYGISHDTCKSCYEDAGLEWTA